jgi:cytosine/creatinine deaminase
LTNPKIFKKSQSSLQEKWDMYREFKLNYSEEDLIFRMSKCVDNMVNQGVKYIRTFVDSDGIVGQKCIDTAIKIKNKYIDKVKIDITIQPLEGLESKESMYNFIEACSKADYIGGLPDRDSSPEKHIDLIFDLASRTNKPVDIHVGQNNLSDEKETELVLDKIIDHNLKQKVSLVHCISLACQDETYIRNQAKRMKLLDVDVIVCPSAAISMKQNNSITSYIHNSIAPVRILLEEGVNVKLGIDNIEDLFMPLVDGDLWFETRLLMESTRIYDFDKIINIVT